MKKIAFLILLTLRCFAASIGEDNNHFAFDLYSKLEEGNLAFSPYGIFSNLSLLSTGAAGETADQMQGILHIGNDQTSFLKAFKKHQKGLTSQLKEGYQLSIANGLFPHKETEILNEFQEMASEVFQAKVQPINYKKPLEATAFINGWISEKTQGKIPHLVHQGDIDSATRLVIANAVYFQGEWSHPFNPKATVAAPFYADDGELDVPMIQQIRSFPYFENEEVQCVSLPFKRKGTAQPRLDCVLLLPKTTLSDLEKSLSAETLSQWLAQSQSTLLNVQVPKFCIKKRIVLSDPLKELGMIAPFTQMADFSKVDGKRDLYLTTVLHETYFAFHESGVTAASATTSHLGLTAVLPPIESAIPFIANHPFLFLIVDTHSKAILFMGRVVNPPGDKCDEI